jgi:peroxiredoxin
MVKCSIAILLLIGVTSAFSQSASEGGKGYILKGTAKNAANTEVYLIETSFYNNTHSLDSTSTNENGAFVFSGKLKEPGYYNLQVKGKSGLRSSILENTEININGDADEINDATITGSEENIVKIKADNLLADTALYRLYQDADKAVKQGVAQNDTLAIKRATKQKEDVKNAYVVMFEKFIDAYPTSLASVGVVDYVIHFGAVKEADSILRRMERSSIGDYGEVLYFRKQINVLLGINVGTQAPEFTQTDTKGNNVSLSSFRGKYILLDFCSSSCSPCIEENPYLVDAYKKYHGKNFQIISISLDNDKNRWLKFVNTYKLNWVNISDLQGYDNKIAIIYAVNYIPQNYLIDPNGKIIDINLKGIDLEATLEKVLN